MAHVEQLDEDTVASYTRPKRGVQESSMRNPLVERPTDVPHRKALTCRLLTKLDGYLSCSISDESQ